MKKVFLLLLIYLGVCSVSAYAQPSWVKKAGKSVFVLKTFKADGSLNGSTNGFFVDADGRAVSSYAPFKGASSGVIIDSDGKEFPIDYILGANETYDVAKFKVNVKKAQPLSLGSSATTVGTGVWLLPYRNVKTLPQGTVRKAERFASDYDYYTVAMKADENLVGCPIMTDDGLVVGVMQRPARQNDTLSYAVSARYADSLRINGLSLNDPALKAVKIKKAIPDDLNQAVLMLYFGANTLDSLSYAVLVDDFIERYPTAPDGYQYRAQLAFNGNNFAAAQRDMETAIKVADKKDESHHVYSKMIYQKEIYKSQLKYEPWSFDLALSEATAAYDIQPLPIYRRQQALVLFSQKKFQESSDIYKELINGPLRSADTFFEAASCREMLRDTLGQLALLDSAVATFSRPYLKEAAPYLLTRAQARIGAQKYRDAVADLNDYESLMKAQVNEHFYFLRFQAAVGGRIFQQALNDINKAIELQPQNDLFYAEKASFLVRVGMYDEAAQTASQLIELVPNQSDGYLFLGLAQCLQNKKQEGMKNLQKAKEMGDPQADELIEKYSR